MARKKSKTNKKAKNRKVITKSKAKTTKSSKKTAKGSGSSKKSSAKASQEIGRWNGHKFIVSPTLIRGFTDLTIKGGSDTKDKTKSKYNYVARKNGQPMEITLTVLLSAATGCDVRKEAIALVAEAEAGASDYFYIARKKLVSSKVILTSAQVKNVKIAHNGTFIYAQVSLTLKQTGKGGKDVSKASGKSGGSKKRSARGSGGGGGSSRYSGGSSSGSSSGTKQWSIGDLQEDTYKNKKVVSSANAEIARNKRNATRGATARKYRTWVKRGEM